MCGHLKCVDYEILQNIKKESQLNTIKLQNKSFNEFKNNTAAEVKYVYWWKANSTWLIWFNHTKTTPEQILFMGNNTCLIIKYINFIFTNTLIY